MYCSQSTAILYCVKLSQLLVYKYNSVLYDARCNVVCVKTDRQRSVKEGFQGGAAGGEGGWEGGVHPNSR